VNAEQAHDKRVAAKMVEEFLAIWLRGIKRRATGCQSGQTHEQWRKEHPTEHPLWCQFAVTGKLQPCDCDLSSNPQGEPK
jgi:hypothetical protein